MLVPQESCFGSLRSPWTKNCQKVVVLKLVHLIISLFNTYLILYFALIFFSRSPTICFLLFYNWQMWSRIGLNGWKVHVFAVFRSHSWPRESFVLPVHSATRNVGQMLGAFTLSLCLDSLELHIATILGNCGIFTNVPYLPLYGKYILKVQIPTREIFFYSTNFHPI